MLSSVMLILTVCFLAGTTFLTAVNSALRKIQKKDMKAKLKEIGGLFFYRPFHLFFFPKNEYEGLFFATICALNITRFSYAASMLIFLAETSLFQTAIEGNYLSWVWLILSLTAFVLVAFFIGDFFPRVLGNKFSLVSLRIASPFASLFMYLTFPFTFLFLKISQAISRRVPLDTSNEPLDKEDIINIIQQSQLGSTYDIHDRQLIESVVRFKERIAREVMVPRVNVFSLPADMSIKESAKLLEKEGYSRIPVYRNSIDNITGVLMYKDVLKKYMDWEDSGKNSSILDAAIETIQKPVLHTPETKKISNLLQEFRKKQVHLAIVVDEYGGTEGIVTIEDILEEIVGDIADEYDQEEELFYVQSDGSWIVNAKMNILDAEEELGIKIPTDGDYDTIGGFVYHTTGTIPSKGFVIHENDFDIEIIDSNDRSVERVRIKSIPLIEHDRDNESK